MMKYPKEYLDEIKSRVKVFAGSRKVRKIKKTRKRIYWFVAILKRETPSFTVNDKAFYHCFSSGEHGNIFDFFNEKQKIINLEKQ